MEQRTKRLKGGYSGDQHYPVRFRASKDLYRTLVGIAENERLCLATLVRRLVILGFENRKN